MWFAFCHFILEGVLGSAFGFIFIRIFKVSNPKFQLSLKTSYFKQTFQLEGGSLHLPLLDSSMRAKPLTPSKWKERLEARACLDLSSSETSVRKLLLLDVRNGEILLHCT